MEIDELLQYSLNGCVEAGRFVVTRLAKLAVCHAPGSIGGLVERYQTLDHTFDMLEAQVLLPHLALGAYERYRA